jgi:inner membrane protein
MDPFTHGLVGAAAGQLAAGPSRLREAAGVGFLAAMLADLDILLNRASDPLFQLELHRQFSHSLLFVPVGALLASALMFGFLRSRLGLGRLYRICLAGYGTAGLLDACTSYGTQLLWPLSDHRFAFNLVAVIDPIVTLGLLVILTVGQLKGSSRWAFLALGWLGFWLLYGAVQQQRAWQAVHGLHRPEPGEIHQIVVKPTLGNQILWRATTRVGNRLYADGVRTTLLASPQVFQGESGALVLVEKDFAPLTGTAAYRDLLRFERLSEGYLVRHPNHDSVIGDARYAMLPTSLSPLWGVRFDPSRPELGVTFETFRENSPEVRSLFMRMLWGQPQAEVPSNSHTRMRARP